MSSQPAQEHGQGSKPDDSKGETKSAEQILKELLSNGEAFKPAIRTDYVIKHCEAWHDYKEKNPRHDILWDVIWDNSGCNPKCEGNGACPLCPPCCNGCVAKCNDCQNKCITTCEAPCRKCHGCCMGCKGKCENDCLGKFCCTGACMSGCMGMCVDKCGASCSAKCKCFDAKCQNWKCCNKDGCCPNQDCDTKCAPPKCNPMCYDNCCKGGLCKPVCTGCCGDQCEKCCVDGDCKKGCRADCADECLPGCVAKFCCKECFVQKCGQCCGKCEFGHECDFCCEFLFAITCGFGVACDKPCNLPQIECPSFLPCGLKDGARLVGQRRYFQIHDVRLEWNFPAINGQDIVDNVGVLYFDQFDRVDNPKTCFVWPWKCGMDGGSIRLTKLALGCIPIKHTIISHVAHPLQVKKVIERCKRKVQWHKQKPALDAPEELWGAFGKDFLEGTFRDEFGIEGKQGPFKWEVPAKGKENEDQRIQLTDPTYTGKRCDQFVGPSSTA